MAVKKGKLFNMEEKTAIINEFRFCPKCGSSKIQTAPEGRKWQCPDCGFVLYNNVASSVGLLIQNHKGEFLFEKRAKEPQKSKFVQPGGFIDPDETAEHAALRECREELGVEVTDLKFLCSEPNTYPYKDIVYKTCDMWFTAVIPEGSALVAQESEVSALEWKKITCEEDIQNADIAFESGKNALRFLLKSLNKGE